MSQYPKTYIEQMHLAGYKSIKDLSVHLQPDLNIIIGANGSGKTNFLEFIEAAFKNDFERLFAERAFTLTIKGHIDAPEGTFSMDMTGKKNTDRRSKKDAYIVEEHLGDGQMNIYNLDDNKKGTWFSSQNLNTQPSIRYLQFDNPLNFILQEKLSIVLDFAFDEKNGYSITSYLKDSSQYTFLNDLFNIDPTISRNRWTGYDSIEGAVKDVINNRVFEDIKYLLESLKRYTPIKDFKIDWDLTRRTIKKDEKDERTGTALIEAIDFLFFVNDEWLNWTQLSDGTKRLFYLIGSLEYAEPNQIFLLEEPEIGIYPHQLTLLMNFIKSYSQHTQILMTTHSPQVLNCLKESELDNIIIARNEGKAGTKMYHLSEDEKGFASNYMKNDAFLSDYWIQSGFVNEESMESL